MLLHTGQFFGQGSSGGGGVPSAAFLSSQRADSVAATSKTFSGVTFNAAAGDLIVVSISLRGPAATGNHTISSVTIGGAAATPAVTETHGSRSDLSAIYYAKPGVSSGSIVINNYSDTINSAVIGVYKIVGQSADAPSATGSNEGLTGGTLSTTCNVPADGFLIACCSGRTANAPFTVGVTTDFDHNAVGGVGGMHGGSFSTNSAVTPRTVTCDPASTDFVVIAAASWEIPGLL